VPSTLKPLDPTQVELEISISPEEYAAAQDAAFRKLARNAKVPGFRPGKVPRKIFENAYGAGQIIDRALNDLVGPKVQAALEEHQLDPVTVPSVEVVGGEGDGPPAFKAHVYVCPEPKDYFGVEVTDVPETASDEDLQQTIDQLRKDAATLVPVDRPVQLGDTAVVDYAGAIDGVPFEGGTATGQEIEVAEQGFIPGFADGIVGMRAGETKEVHATFPDPYSNAELAGKQAVFTITVHEVKEPELPELDDEFAKRASSGRIETFDALRDDVRRRLDERVRDRARRRMSEELLQKIVAANDVPVPEDLVARELDQMVSSTRSNMARAGIPWDDYLTATGKTEDDVRSELRAEAERQVKTALLVEAIAKKEGIQETPEDMAAEVRALSAQYGQPPERIVELLRADERAFRGGIVRTKTIDKLIEQARRVPATEVAAQ
jgi:trigger factor